jgi:hypothetical protein
LALHLEHFHVGLLATADCVALARTATGEKDLHAEVAEDGVADGGIYRLLCTGLHLVKIVQDLGGGRVDLGPLLSGAGRENRLADRGHGEKQEHN